MFRALNFSMSNDESMCEMVYIELEYRESPIKCKYDRGIPQNTDIRRISPTKPFVFNEENESFTVNNERNPFFYYQDFYFEEPDESFGEFEIKISIHQKFIEKNMIDFVVEIFENDVDY